jgi:hypothetical protein
MGTPAGDYATLEDLVDASQGTDVSQGFVLEQANPLVTFQTAQIPPPSPLYVTLDDAIDIQVLNSNPLLTAVDLRLRFLTPDGTLRLLDYQFQGIPSDRSAVNKSFVVAEGFILSASVYQLVTAPRRGQTWVRVELKRGPLTANIGSQQLINDYLTNLHGPQWPNGSYGSEVDGAGHLYTFQGVQPAAGADAAITVPSSTRWRLQACSFFLQTSAAVGTRHVLFVVDDGANLQYAIGTPANQNPSTGVRYSLAPATALASDGSGFITLPLPATTMLPGGSRIRTQTFGLDAGDQWLAPSAGVEEWIEL